MTSESNLFDPLKSVGSLGDDELLHRTQAKAAQERKLTAEVLKLLEEINRRKLFATKGFSSLFSFCVEFLGYSESSAQRRVASVRLMRQLPEIETKISEGSLTLSNVAQAEVFFQSEAKQNHPMTLEEKREVLKKLEGKSTRQGERQLIALSSNPESFVQKEKIRALSESNFEVKFVADQKLLDNLEHVRGLLAHRNPNLSMAELIGEMAKIAIEKLQPKKPTERKPSAASPIADPINDESVPGKAPAPAVEKTRTASPPIQKETRYIPAAVKSEVYHRDGGECSFVDTESGRICGSRFGIEYDHLVKPYGRGGKNTTQNLALRCKSHNSRQAIQDYGLNKMETFWNRKTEPHSRAKYSKPLKKVGSQENACDPS